MFSLKVRAFDERFKLGHGHALLVTVLALCHSLLNNCRDFLRCLSQDLVHVLGHWVHVAEVLECGLGSLGVGVERGLVLLEELLFDGDVVVGDAQHDQAVLRLARLLGQASH